MTDSLSERIFGQRTSSNYFISVWLTVFIFLISLNLFFWCSYINCYFHWQVNFFYFFFLIAACDNRGLYHIFSLSYLIWLCVCVCVFVLFCFKLLLKYLFHEYCTDTDTPLFTSVNIFFLSMTMLLRQFQTCYTILCYIIIFYYILILNCTNEVLDLKISFF